MIRQKTIKEQPCYSASVINNEMSRCVALCGVSTAHAITLCSATVAKCSILYSHSSNPHYSHNLMKIKKMHLHYSRIEYNSNYAQQTSKKICLYKFLIGKMNHMGFLYGSLKNTSLSSRPHMIWLPRFLFLNFYVHLYWVCSKFIIFY